MSEGGQEATDEGLIACTKLSTGSWTKRRFRGQEQVGEEEGALHDDGFSVFLVQVESDTPIGRELLRNPLGVLRTIDDIDVDIPEKDVRAVLVRVNAEIPANPRHRSELWMVAPGSTTAVGIQFKHDD